MQHLGHILLNGAGSEAFDQTKLMVWYAFCYGLGCPKTVTKQNSKREVSLVFLFRDFSAKFDLDRQVGVSGWCVATLGFTPWKLKNFVCEMEFWDEL